jgi:uncharacterized protein YjeT (DUF2065 family)
MELVTGIERLTALVLVITGLSHLTAARQWARFFAALRERSPAPGFVIAWIHGPPGFLIVAFHWVWTWPQAVVTLIGCGLTLKAALHFTFPALAMRSLAHVSEDRPGRFRAAGLAALALGLWIGWLSLAPPAAG